MRNPSYRPPSEQETIKKQILANMHAYAHELSPQQKKEMQDALDTGFLETPEDAKEAGWEVEDITAEISAAGKTLVKVEIVPMPGADEYAPEKVPSFMQLTFDDGSYMLLSAEAWDDEGFMTIQEG